MQDIKSSIDKQEVVQTQETTVFEDSLTEKNMADIKEKAKEFLEFFEGKDTSEISWVRKYPICNP